MKNLLVIMGAFFSKHFGAGVVSIETNEKAGSVTLTEEYATKLVERAQAADVAEARVEELTGQVNALQGGLTEVQSAADASAARVTELEAEVAQLGKQPGKLGVVAKKEGDMFETVENPYETSADREMKMISEQLNG